MAAAVQWILHQRLPEDTLPSEEAEELQLKARSEGQANSFKEAERCLSTFAAATAHLPAATAAGSSLILTRVRQCLSPWLERHPQYGTAPVPWRLVLELYLQAVLATVPRSLRAAALPFDVDQMTKWAATWLRPATVRGPNTTLSQWDSERTMEAAETADLSQSLFYSDSFARGAAEQHYAWADTTAMLQSHRQLQRSRVAEGARSSKRAKTTISEEVYEIADDAAAQLRKTNRQTAQLLDEAVVEEQRQVQAFEHRLQALMDSGGLVFADGNRSAAAAGPNRVSPVPDSSTLEVRGERSGGKRGRSFSSVGCTRKGFVQLAASYVFCAGSPVTLAAGNAGGART